MLVCGYNLLNFYYFQFYLWLFFFFPLPLIWFVSCSAETNRTPFNFAEGESELVSGFNIEYGGGGFALIFLAEYARILFIRFLFCVLFLGCDMSSLFFDIRVTFVSFLFIWVRGTWPGFRYEKLIYLA
jgi:NADH-ubiquinone oxidoreductase chain 1